MRFPREHVVNNCAIRIFMLMCLFHLRVLIPSSSELIFFIHGRASFFAATVILSPFGSRFTATFVSLRLTLYRHLRLLRLTLYRYLRLPSAHALPSPPSPLAHALLLPSSPSAHALPLPLSPSAHALLLPLSPSAHALPLPLSPLVRALPQVLFPSAPRPPLPSLLPLRPLFFRPLRFGAASSVFAAGSANLCCGLACRLLYRLSSFTAFVAWLSLLHASSYVRLLPFLPS